MRYSLLITADPHTDTPASALHTARALLAAGHELHRVFLYRAGVGLARSGAEVPDAARQWQTFLDETGVDAVACIGTAERHGIGEQETAAPWRLAGLGEWVEALNASDRILQFGA